MCIFPGDSPQCPMNSRNFWRLHHHLGRCHLLRMEIIFSLVRRNSVMFTWRFSWFELKWIGEFVSQRKICFFWVFLSNLSKIWFEADWLGWEKWWRFLQVFIWSSPGSFPGLRKYFFVEDPGLCSAWAQSHWRCIIPSMSDFEERGRAPEQLVEAVAADDHDMEADESKKYLKSRHYCLLLPPEDHDMTQSWQVLQEEAGVDHWFPSVQSGRTLACTPVQWK